MPESTADNWIASVYRSGLDERVWVPTILGVSVADGECMSSTSVRRVKRYVEARLLREFEADDRNWQWWWEKCTPGPMWEFHAVELDS